MNKNLSYSLGTIFLLCCITYINTSYSLTEDLVYPIDSKINGSSYEDWAIKYWQWWATVPKNPDMDSTFKYSPQLLEKCFIGDDFPVLFLVNPIIVYHLDGNKKVYDCNIPANKPIFVLGISEMCNYGSPKENNPDEKLKTDEELEACVHQRNPWAAVTLKIDDIEIGKDETEKYSLTTDFFNITIPEDSANSINGIGTNRALLDGKFLILKPLPIGDHTINYKVVQIIPHKESDNLFLDIKYNLHVQ